MKSIIYVLFLFAPALFQLGPISDIRSWWSSQRITSHTFIWFGCRLQK